MIVEKDIFQVTKGSFVVAIIEQKGDYKIKKPGWVRDFKAIEYLIKQGVLRVSVDTSKHLERLQKAEKTPTADKSHGSSESQELRLNTSKKSQTDKSAVRRTPPSSETKKNFSESLIKAKQTFDAAKKVQSKVLDDIKNGKAIDPGPVKEITNQSIEAIFDNPDALACVLNIRNKNEYLLEHSVSVSVLVAIFARHLKLDKIRTQELAVGGFLHDVGKIFVADEILNKPGKLTDEEFEIIKTHAVHSKRIIDETNGVSDVTRSVVANHHEKLDGSGYPRGLDQKELSKFDRMISICDVFDALSAHRVYKQGLAQIRAFAILREMASCSHLDPQLVDQFIRCLGIYPIGSLVKLSSNRLAIVDSRNLDNPTKPKVKAFYNLNLNVFTAAKEIDLSSTVEECIEQGVRADEFDLDINKITEFLLMQG